MGKRSQHRQTADQEDRVPLPPSWENGVARPKTIYLIRHGQSEGQTAKQDGRDRKRDPGLLDCQLTRKGEQEAAFLGHLLSQEEASISLVVTSPLSRALRTALLGFPDKDLLVHYGLCELGSGIPENRPRPMSQVLHDQKDLLEGRSEGLLLDTTSLQPSDWPRKDTHQKKKNGDRIQQAFQWLYQERSESVIAVVTHYNVIRQTVQGGAGLAPGNAQPIRCQLYPNGVLVLDPNEG